MPPPTLPDASCLPAFLQGRCVVQVGGSDRHGIGAAVQAAGGEFAVADMARDDLHEFLVCALPLADLVVLPPSHGLAAEQLALTARLCRCHGVGHHVLPADGVAGLVALVAVLQAAATRHEAAGGPAPASHFCLRHG